MIEKASATNQCLVDIPPCEAGCTQKTDLVLQSQDGIRFGAHSTNLAAFSDAFPVIGSGIIANEVVKMTERADVVLLLLQLTHRQRWMRSDRIPFGLLQGLAEAAEKFFIPAIMEMCRVQMQAAVSKHPLDVFIYACKHGYDDIQDAAAPGTLDLPFESTLRRLKVYPSICISWLWRDEFPCTLKYCGQCNEMLPMLCDWIRTELAKMNLPSFTNAMNETCVSPTPT
ncbi:hypothetical protein FB446DRAFT_704161 [Lentinula raphanica]|nr:hypothetical protein FB446DRAFT_704161 [Lentinula raphanica]